MGPMTRGNPFRYICLFVLEVLLLDAGAQTGAPPSSLQSFDRYGVILERKPFGAESVPSPVELPKISPEQSFTAKYKMVAVTRNDSGIIQVGLVDLKTKQSVMLGIGDSVEGVEVVEADYVKEKARLKRDPEDYWVSMSGGSNSFEVVSKAQPPQIQQAISKPSTSAVVAPRSTTARSSYAARREARLRKELQQIQAMEALHAKESKTTDATSVASVRAGRQKTDASGKAVPISDTAQALLRLLNSSDNAELSPAEVNSLLQQYQKELIRSGQTPLPIPLTPETDQELVNEGILPAME